MEKIVLGYPKLKDRVGNRPVEEAKVIKNLKEIAATLGLTETRICQLHKQAVKQLHNVYHQWER